MPGSGAASRAVHSAAAISGPPTPSGRLKRKIGLVTAPLVAATERLMVHPRIREAYPEYLITVHGIIRASVPLMQSAVRRARATAASDPAARGLIVYLERHVEEERGHDEWVLEDLEVLGIDLSLVLSRVPSPAVACLVGSQYYWTIHYHPVALLGYLAVTEGYSSPPGLIEDLIQITGLPRPAFRTLAEHAELDLDHGVELDRLLDSLPLTPEHEEAIALSAMTSVHHMARCLDEACEAAER